MSDSKSPKVSIIDNVKDSVDVLKEIQEEMQRRFKVSQKVGRKSIDPDKDKMPRIVVGGDEC